MSTLIREDSFSVYAKVGGYIARPVFPRGWISSLGKTAHQAGDKVAATHSGGPTAWVGQEIWYLHGCYFGSNGKMICSEHFWKPDYDEWSK